MRQICDKFHKRPETRMDTRGEAGSIPAASTTKHFRIKDLRIGVVIILGLFGAVVASE